MKAVQKFSKEYLRECRKLTPQQIAEFVDNFRQLHGEKQNLKSKLISMKVPEALLEAFRVRCNLEEIPYQTQIKILMKTWMGG